MHRKGRRESVLLSGVRVSQGGYAREATQGSAGESKNSTAKGQRTNLPQTGSERLIWAQGAPSTLRAITTTIRGVRINMASAICWENYMPLLRQTIYSQNVNLYLAPTADNRDAWLGLMRTVGVEGRCFVVSSNMAIVDGKKKSDAEFELAQPKSPRRGRRQSVFDEDGNEIVLCRDKGDEGEKTKGEVARETTDKTVKWLSRGGSSIVTPFGDVVAGPQWEDPDGLIYADVDFRDCIRGRLDLDAAGSYSRNDSFRLSVEGLDLNPLPY